MSLAGEERKQTILDMLQLQGKVRTPELVRALDVSSETIRRYLEELENENKLKRVYGGAVKLNVEREEQLTANVKCFRQKRRSGSAGPQLLWYRTTISLLLTKERQHCR